MSSMRQQQWSTKNIFCKQKSIDDKTPQQSGDSSRKILRKQLSVDHVTSNLKHSTSSSSASSSSSCVAVPFGNLLWQNNFAQDPNFKITSALKKRAQFASSGGGGGHNSINKQDLLSSCLSMKAAAGGEVTKTKDKINISLFLSQDIAADDGSDNEHVAANNNSHKAPSVASTVSVNAKPPTETTASGKLSVKDKRAQFQASRRIMSAPIRPLNQFEDPKNKRKPTRKKKVIRDKELDESPDDYAEEVEDVKPPINVPPPQRTTKKAPPMRSRSVLGCDQMGIETLVSMINSGESDSEKEEQSTPPPPPPAIKNDPPTQRVRANMLRKTVSFQDDDSQLQAVAATTGKDAFNFRRNVVPFAGRMRNTRSLFGQEICNLYMNSNNSTNINNNNNNNNNEQKIDVKNENDLNSSNHAQAEVKERAKLKKFESFDERRTQDILTQPREEECWRLYEKMKKTGLNISYDTILRGILKPSELRLLEKQKKLLGNIEEKPLEDAEIAKSDE